MRAIFLRRNIICPVLSRRRLFKVGIRRVKDHQKMIMWLSFVTLCICTYLQMEFASGESPAGSALHVSHVCEGDTAVMKYKIDNTRLEAASKMWAAQIKPRDGKSNIMKKGTDGVKIKKRISLQLEENVLVYRLENATESDEGTYVGGVEIDGGLFTSMERLDVLRTKDCPDKEMFDKPNITMSTPNKETIGYENVLRLIGTGTVALKIQIPAADPPVTCMIKIAEHSYSCTGSALSIELCVAEHHFIASGNNEINVILSHVALESSNTIIKVHIEEPVVTTITPMSTESSTSVILQKHAGLKPITIILWVILAVLVLIAVGVAAVLLYIGCTNKQNKEKEAHQTRKDNEIAPSKLLEDNAQGHATEKAVLLPTGRNSNNHLSCRELSTTRHAEKQDSTRLSYEDENSPTYGKSNGPPYGCKQHSFAKAIDSVSVDKDSQNKGDATHQSKKHKEMGQSQSLIDNEEPYAKERHVDFPTGENSNNLPNRNELSTTRDAERSDPTRLSYRNEILPTNGKSNGSPDGGKRHSFAKIVDSISGDQDKGDATHQNKKHEEMGQSQSLIDNEEGYAKERHVALPTGGNSNNSPNRRELSTTRDAERSDPTRLSYKDEILPTNGKSNGSPDGGKRHSFAKIVDSISGDQTIGNNTQSSDQDNLDKNELEDISFPTIESPMTTGDNKYDHRKRDRKLKVEPGTKAKTDVKRDAETSPMKDAKQNKPEAISLPATLKTKGGIKVHIFRGDLTTLKVDAVVNASNPQLIHGGGVAGAIKNAAGPKIQKECTQHVRRWGDLLISQTYKSEAYNMTNCRCIIHVAGPIWRNYSPEEAGKLLYQSFHNCLEAAADQCSIAIPAVGSGIYECPLTDVAKQMFRAVNEFISNHESGTLKDILLVDINREILSELVDIFQQAVNDDILEPITPECDVFLPGNAINTNVGKRGEKRPNLTNTTLTSDSGGFYEVGVVPKKMKEMPLVSLDRGNVETCSICFEVPSNAVELPVCKHIYCKECIDTWFKEKPCCPSCGELYGVVLGNQPDGTMSFAYVDGFLPGFDTTGIIVIDYVFPDGTQTDRHPKPGHRYYGTTRRAFLPDNKAGQEVLDLLRRAFDAKVTFTIGTSATTGREDQVIWNDIHHKTNIKGGPQSFGYPDPGYLSRVKEELAAKGIK